MIWHYTTLTKMRMILDSRHLRMTPLEPAPGEVPAVWFTTSEEWDPTCTKKYAFRDLRISDFNMTGLLTFEQLQKLQGIVRIGVTQTAEVLVWAEYAALCPEPSARLLATAPKMAQEIGWHGKRWGPAYWRMFLRPVQVEEFEKVEVCTLGGPVRQAIIDFETNPVEQRPKYPPDPVGLASASCRGNAVLRGVGARLRQRDLRAQGQQAAQGGRRSQEVGDPAPPRIGQVRRACWATTSPSSTPRSPRAWASRFQTSKIRDSLFSRFIVDPRAKSLSLKPAAEEVLGEPPEERDAVYEWLYEHGLTSRKKVTAATSTAPRTTRLASGSTRRQGRWWRLRHRGLHPLAGPVRARHEDHQARRHARRLPA
jgi:hypothetical protein